MERERKIDWCLLRHQEMRGFKYEHKIYHHYQHAPARRLVEWCGSLTVPTWYGFIENERATPLPMAV